MISARITQIRPLSRRRRRRRPQLSLRRKRSRAYLARRKPDGRHGQPGTTRRRPQSACLSGWSSFAIIIADHVSRKSSGNVLLSVVFVRPFVSTLAFELTDLDFCAFMRHGHSSPRIESYSKNFQFCSILPPNTPEMGVNMNRHFSSQARVTLKHSSLQNCIADFNQILHNDKDLSGL